MNTSENSNEEVKERTFRQKMGEMDMDAFLSPEFLSHIIETRPERDVKFVFSARIMLHDIQNRIRQTAEHAFYGKTLGEKDYTSGYYAGGKEIELFAYTKETEMPKTAFLEKHKSNLPEEILEDLLKSEKPTIKIVEPLGIGFDFWVDDSYGRVSEIRAFPDGRVIEQPHGRASVFIRDPVNPLAGLPNHELYKVLDDKRIMQILKCTSDLDNLVGDAKTYNEVRAKLVNATAQVD